jgi:transcriptional regulator with XRE-family HTH domain
LARRQLREQAGLSRPAVAELIGVSAEAMRLWEIGDREPEGENRRRYVDLLVSWRAKKAAEPASDIETSG